MSTEDPKQRYDEILKNIASRRPFGGRPREERKLSPQERVLDLLNAFDALADLTQRSYSSILAYGPKAFRGPAWSGAVLWHHRRGYHGYQVLNLLGVWAHYHEDDIVISVGIRQLPYRAPVYDPGVYRVAIENNFKIYYEDEGGPPAKGDKLLYRAPFDLKERLATRRRLVEILRQWREEAEGS